jgi:hypothetical protein
VYRKASEQRVHREKGNWKWFQTVGGNRNTKARDLREAKKRGKKTNDSGNAAWTIKADEKRQYKVFIIIFKKSMHGNGNILEHFLSCVKQNKIRLLD